MKNPALYTACVVFGVVSLAHLVRFFRADEVLISGYLVPVPWSLALGIVIFALAAWMFVAAKR